MKKFQFKLMWAFDGEQNEHKMDVFESAVSINGACINAVKNCAGMCAKRGAHIVELTFIGEV